MDWIKNFFITRFLKGLLDKLPANNKKTILGVILLVLSVLQQMFPDNPVAPMLQAVLDLLKSMGAEDLQTLSIGVVVTGLIHKLLKLIFKEEKKDNNIVYSFDGNRED